MTEQDFDNPRLWEISKPFLKDFYVPYSVYDPTFHKRSMTKTPAPLDPCCTSCRKPDDQATVIVYVDDDSFHPTLESIEKNKEPIESSLREKLRAIQRRNLADHLEENIQGMPAWQKHWSFILKALEAESAPDISRMFKMTGVSLVLSEPEQEWVVGYEFQTAWDMDHGLEILMWKDRVLAAGGMMELTSTGGSPFAGAKAIQEYSLDEIDYRLT